MVENDIDFMMEAADRTSADRKGGHLCIRRGQGLALRESAQCPDDEKDDFQDVNKYKYFNTNNLWVHVPSLAALMDHHGGILPLQTIVNRKTLDPRDPDSEPVFQLETAMGSAISLFPNAAAVRVPRSRFSPVKTTSDLLGVQSDAYQLTEDSRIVLDPSRKARRPSSWTAPTTNSWTSSAVDSRAAPRHSSSATVSRSPATSPSGRASSSAGPAESPPTALPREFPTTPSSAVPSPPSRCPAEEVDTPRHRCYIRRPLRDP
jgi:UDP-N-acetylglucosamine pyrophosphorylase